MLVYVLNRYGKPLMPCSARKARILLKQKKAIVKKREPFTIQLLYGSSGYKQDISLGVDCGSKHVGLSATTNKKELYASEVTLRNNIVDLLSTKRENRRTRRNHLRYRPSRFNNRVHSKNKGWFAPSVKHKIQTHLRVIKNVYKILPVKNLIVEIASFDIQKIKNPNIQGTEYQNGEQLGFWNTREYILFRDGHKCQNCKGKSKDPILNVHHIQSRKIGGDAPNNLITLCETCHNLYHKGEIQLKLKRGFSFKDATFMGIMKWALYEKLKMTYDNINLTFGYITKSTRIKYNLPKEHYIDARCISGNPLAKPLGYIYFQKKIRCHNRQIHKANLLKGSMKKLNQAPYKVFGFRLFDKVKYNNIDCFIFGRRQSGYFDLRKLNGTRINDSVNYKKLILLESKKYYLTERRITSDSYATLKDGIILA